MNKITFNYGGQRREYIVSFEVSDDNIFSDCSCPSRKPCKHIQSLLIGRAEKVRDDQAGSLREFLNQLSRTEAGRQLIHDARIYFQEENRCRRCNSENIVDTHEKTLSSRLYRLISPHRHYCKNCKWSW